MNTEYNRRGYKIIGLDNPKSMHNVGSALRLAGCYDVHNVIITGKRYKITSTDPSKNHKHLPLIQVDDLHDAVPFDCVPVAVDLVEGAVPLDQYEHPERAMYIFGQEDGTLGKRILSWCRDKVYIQTNGCLNLSHAIATVLYDRQVKRKEFYNAKV